MKFITFQKCQLCLLVITGLSIIQGGCEGTSGGLYINGFHIGLLPVKVTSELPGKGNLLDAMLKSGLAMVSAAGLYANGLHCDSEASNSEHLWLTLD